MSDKAIKRLKICLHVTSVIDTAKFSIVTNGQNGVTEPFLSVILMTL